MALEIHLFASVVLSGTLTGVGVNLTGTATANAFVGSGSGLTSLSASALASGTVPSGRLSGSYTGITGVGTVTAGTWQGTAVAVANGGTGATTASAARTALGLGTTNSPVFAGMTITGTVTANRFVGDGAGLTGVPVPNSSVGASQLLDGAVTSDKLGIGVIFDANVASNAAISRSKLTLTNGIASSDLKTGSVTSDKISDGTITNADIYPFAAIDLTKLARSDMGLSYIMRESTVYGVPGADIPLFTFDHSGDMNQTNNSLLALKFSGINSPRSTDKFVSFYSSNGTDPIGKITGSGGGAPSYTLLEHSSLEAVAFSDIKGVVLSSTGADYAEYIRRESPRDSFSACDIVGIKEGKVVNSIQSADQFMVISQRPVVIGNNPPDSEKNQYELVAFVGQVYVKVRGSVNSGQYIVASETEPGVGFAKNEADLTLEDCSRIVGKAWETSPSDALRVVKIGLTTAASNAVTGRIKKLESDVATLKAALERVLSTQGSHQ